MIKNNNVIHISKRLNQDRKEREREDGVILSETYVDVTGEPDSTFDIEIYEKRQHVNTCLCVSFGKDTKLAELTVDEAVELGQAILLAARGSEYE